MSGLGAGLWRTAPLLLAITMLFWAGNSIAGRALAGVVPPMTLTFWRWVLASLLVAPLAWPHLKRDWPELRRRWKTVILLAVSGVASFGALLYWGLESTTALNSLLMQAAIPPLILFFGFVLLRDRIGVGALVGVALSLAGVLVVISEGRPWDLLHLRLNPGDGIILIGVVLYAGYSLLLRRRPQVHPLSLLLVTFILAALVIAPFYAHELIQGRTFAPTPTALGGILYVALFPSFLAYLCFNRGVELIGSAPAGQYMHLMPVFGAVLAITLLGEPFHGYHAIGVALIATGIGATAWAGRRSAAR
ncbi:DMT family transporter [Caulobacter sp. SLTY]|uniref:DMT family transporter n=1 Tax=Caulobacter sp. SLTY TaxID=2683262 RepID=UPI00196A3048|nr:DMT family transporter [Caulobacter sp. SLTY]